MSPGTHERRPRAGAAHVEGRPGGSAQSLPPTPDVDPTVVRDSAPTVDLARMTPRARAIWQEAWISGYIEGYAAGAAHADERFWAGVEFQRRYEDHARGLAAMLASRPPYDVLADRRGEPERADAQRRTLAGRGIWPPPAPGERVA